jgi:hypothetical protein
MTDDRGSKSAPFKTDKRYLPTKTGLIGVQRETMLQNELHYLVSFYKFYGIFYNFYGNFNLIFDTK